MRHFFPSQTLRTALTALAVTGALSIGCSDDETPEKKCGGVERDGQCFKLCDEAKCAENNLCFKTEERPEGFCALQCTDVAGCPIGYKCDPNHETLSGESGLGFCKGLGLASDGALGTTCTGDAQCDTGHGFTCLGGKCTTPCAAIGDACPTGYECVGNPSPSAGGAKGMCAETKVPVVDKQYGTPCPSGKDDACDTANGFSCVGPVGEGYCTKKDGCTSDDQCPTGYWCGTMRTALDDKNIDFSKRPRACVKRTWCTPCSTDVDCSLQLGAVCAADTNGEKFCSMPCVLGGNSCIIGAECVDTGGGKGVCRPDVGVCHEANPKGCSPCRNDADCGDNAICAGGSVGYKPGMNWCLTPCGEENGKSTCPVAPNGLEMMCLDDVNYDLGGPFSASDPNYIYKHCYAPYTVDNTEKYLESDPPRNTCGNYVREPGEECDDGNMNSADGCADCKVTADCTFSATEPNGDLWLGEGPALNKEPGHLTIGTDWDPNMKWVISTQKCPTFKVFGSIDAPGDVDTVAFMLSNEQYAWLETFSGEVGACNGDLRTEVRPWGNAEQSAKLNLMDPDVKCEQLTSEIKDLANNKLCSDNKLGCGSCTQSGLCGQCDSDNGIGACNRMLVSTSTKLYGQYEVKFDGKYRMIRIYGQDPTVTVSDYVIVVQKFVAQSNFGTSTPPALSCY